MKCYFQKAASLGLVRGEQQFPRRTKLPRQVPRFLVPRGTPVAVQQVTGIAWQPHTTTKDNGFDRFERYLRDQACYEFRVGLWLMRVHRGMLCIETTDECVRLNVGPTSCWSGESST